jgi:hypothetical protein
LACGTPIFPIGESVCYDPTFTVACGRAGPARPLPQGRDMSGKKAGSVFDVNALFEQEL